MSESVAARINRISFLVHPDNSVNPVQEFLAGDGEGVLRELLVEFYFLDAELGKEGAHRHLEFLRKTEGNEHALHFLEFAVLRTQRRAAVVQKEAHHSSGFWIYVKVGGVTFRVDKTKSPLFLLIRNCRDLISRLIEPRQRSQTKLRQWRHLDVRHRAVGLLSVVDLFKHDRRSSIDLHAQLRPRSHQRKRTRNRLHTVRRIKLY